jgi:hypothetical protein
MSIKPRRWFVILTGDDVNPIIARSFPDASLHEGLRIKIGREKSESKDAWEILPSQLEALSTFLVSGNFKIKPLVAVQVGDEPVRYADREEYDADFRRKQKRQQSVSRDARKKAAPPTKKRTARMTAKKCR